jgi:D-glycerate 3-kinase
MKTAIISLDDFYLTRHERQVLADNVHPLLATRGVPGTHDIGLLIDVQTRLKAGQSALIPQFDKASDDRTDALKEQPPVDLILCEGWCWSAEPEPDDRLIEPINSLERERDPDGTWRRYVNQALYTYQDAFAADGSIFLKAPAMAAVFDWRWQQEEELRAGRSAHSEDVSAHSEDVSAHNEDVSAHSGIMNKTQVRDFIAYYERLTRWMLESLPGRVDVCVELAEDHHIRAIHGFR